MKFDEQLARDAAAALAFPPDGKSADRTTSPPRRPTPIVQPVIRQPRPGWQIQAACRGMDVNLWFPEHGENGNTAKRICRDCPVQEECQQYAVGNFEQHGIWGGTSVRERQAVGSPRVAHGTAAGYMAHWRRGESPCEECRVQHNIAQADYARKRRQAAREAS